MHEGLSPWPAYRSPNPAPAAAYPTPAYRFPTPHPALFAISLNLSPPYPKP